MAETKTYTVTKLAGPKVAGRAVAAGQELELTEAEARTELLSGAIVEGAKGSEEVKKADPLAASGKLADIQARASGLEKAPAEAKPAKADAAPAGGKAGQAAAETPAS